MVVDVDAGSYPGAEDLASLTEVGHRTAWTFHNLPVTSGIFCYATVRGTYTARTTHVSAPYMQYALHIYLSLHRIMKKCL